MGQVISLGPLAIPLGLLVLFAAVGLGQWVAGRVSGGRVPGLDLHITGLLGGGLLAARLAFVWQQRGAYAAEPWSVLDIRDGGWSPLAGWLCAGVLVLVFAWRTRPLARPLLLGLGSSAAAWVGALLLVLGLARPPVLLPALSLPSLQGAPTPLGQFSGRPVVVNLWATWCPPCVREMPVLAEAQRLHPTLHIVFVNQGEPAARVQAFLQSRGLDLQHVLLDEAGALAAQLGHRALPTTLFFDAQGRLVDTRVGELSRATLAQRLQALQQDQAALR